MKDLIGPGEWKEIRCFKWECLRFRSMGGFPGGSVAKNLPANAGDTGLIPGLGRSQLLQSH